MMICDDEYLRFREYFGNPPYEVVGLSAEEIASIVAEHNRVDPGLAARWVHPLSEIGPVVHRATLDRVAPPGRQGREATRSLIIRDQLHRDRHIGAICEMKDYGPFDSAWRGLLSLRDPTGAAHAVGPPGVVPADLH